MPARNAGRKALSGACVRAQLLERGMLADSFFKFSYRPFDERWLYWDPFDKLLDEKRVDYFPQAWDGNIALTAAAAIRKGTVEGPCCHRKPRLSPLD